MDPMVPLCPVVFQVVGTQSVLVHAVVPWQMQGFLFLCIEFHGIPINPFFHPVEVPLNGSMTLSVRPITSSSFVSHGELWRVQSHLCQ